MLHVILLILKILGIILLIIVGILLLILCSVLFVAASYRVRIEKHDAIRVSARAGWLFRIVTICFSLDSADNWKQKLQIRLFGFPIWNLYAERKPKKRRKESVQTVPEPPEPLGMLPEQSASESEAGPEPAIHPSKTVQDMKRISGEKTQKRKPSLMKKIRFFFQKVIYAIKGICDKIKHMGKQIFGIGEKVRSLSEKKDALLEFWNLEEHRRARGAVFKELQYLWKKCRPRRIEGKITFGFDDPSVTGLCMGGVGMLCAWYPDRLQIIPDFEHVILEGDVLIKGKIRFYALALILWRVYFNQDIRHMYEHWKQL